MAKRHYAAREMDLQQDAEFPDAQAQPLPPLPTPPVFVPPAATQSYDLAPTGIYAPRKLRPVKPGQLTPAWRTLFVSGWLGVIFGFAAVWQSSRVSGISPWWLGPETNQRLFVVIALPFVGPVTALVAGIAKFRIACYIGIAASLLTGAIALGDRTRFAGIAAVEAALACAGLLISIGALAGRMRQAR